jgi:CheY-like chemotaxis protein
MGRILVIDDEEKARRIIDVMLRNAGHDPVLTVDGHEGLQRFEQQPFDLIICDLFMPNQEGIATLRELRRLDSLVPVIMMSAGMESYVGIAHVDYLTMAEAFGATRTIEKPFKYSQLFRLVQEYLSGS